MNQAQMRLVDARLWKEYSELKNAQRKQYLRREAYSLIMDGRFTTNPQPKPYLDDLAAKWAFKPNEYS